MSGIDFVITWVDNSDPGWRRDLNKWRSSITEGCTEQRYRDWHLLKFLFRAFENFTPWVRKIHFVTQGHLPPWLEVTHPKLNIVTHDSFLKKEYLPVFSSHPIELNFHRIDDLAEQFVYFNDDMFILRPIKQERFFKKGLPRDMMAFTSLLMTHLAHIRLNDLLIVNRHFQKIKILKKHFSKWFNPKYGIHLLKSLFLLPWPHITGFVDPHQPQPFRKSIYKEVWVQEFKTLDETSRMKFRTNADVNQYLFRYWQLMTGKFDPVSFHDAACIQVENYQDAQKAASMVLKQKHRLLCINDLIEGNDDKEFSSIQSVIIDAFNKILPDKSDFEL